MLSTLILLNIHFLCWQLDSEIQEKYIDYFRSLSYELGPKSINLHSHYPHIMKSGDVLENTSPA